jgi:hypothetical protein
MIRFLCFFLCAGLFALPAWGLPGSYTEKALSTPDLYQGDRQARLPGGGRGYCAPVAVSNSLVWLMHNGFPSLLPPATLGRVSLNNALTFYGV